MDTPNWPNSSKLIAIKGDALILLSWASNRPLDLVEACTALPHHTPNEVALLLAALVQEQVLTPCATQSRLIFQLTVKGDILVLLGHDEVTLLSPRPCAYPSCTYVTGNIPPSDPEYYHAPSGGAWFCEQHRHQVTQAHSN